MTARATSRSELSAEPVAAGASSTPAGLTASPAAGTGVVAPRRSRARRVRRGWLVRRMLVAADVTGLLAAFAATELLFGNSGIGTGTRAAIFVVMLPAWVVAAMLYGLYDRDEERTAHSTADELFSVFHLITVGAWFFYATSWIVALPAPGQQKLTTFWLFALLGVTGARLGARALARRRPSYVQHAVVVGAGDVGQLIGRKLKQHPEYRIELLGYVDAAPKPLRGDVADVEHLGEPKDIEEIVRLHGVDRVIVAFSLDTPEQTLELIGRLRRHDVLLDVVPRLYEAVSPKTAVHGIEGLPLLGLTPTRIPRASRLVKRALDLVGASLLLVLAAPVMLVIAALVRWDSPGPIFFRQVRLGMSMRSFTMLKFRTMRDGTDEAAHRAYVERIMATDALPSGSSNLYKLDRPEVTRIGRWLRRTSLDELPQLVNVLRGDMSLVGPRPSIPYEIELFLPHHFERFDVPAGLTGLWQVEARAHSTFAEALDMDVAYVRGWSFGLDLRLLLRTPLVMVRRRETD